MLTLLLQKRLLDWASVCKSSLDLSQEATAVRILPFTMLASNDGCRHGSRLLVL